MRGWSVDGHTAAAGSPRSSDSPYDPECWHAFRYAHPIGAACARAEHAAFCQILGHEGVGMIVAELDDPALQDAILPFDPVLLTNAGTILLCMGKELLRPEVAVLERILVTLGIPILGHIEPPGTVEGGDCPLRDEQMLVDGRSYRTNAATITWLATLPRPLSVQTIALDLPHWHGPAECLHVLSLLSPVARDLVVAYLPLFPIRLAELLHAHRIQTISVPDGGFPTQAPNVLAIAPRHCLILRESLRTIELLRETGCIVYPYDGQEISPYRSGVPTCLTRPLLRTDDP